MSIPKYEKPILTAIELKPEQAIIQQCVIGGQWMNFFTQSHCQSGTGGAGQCPNGVRGQRVTSATRGVRLAAPS